jgi:hypothetical protein
LGIELAVGVQARRAVLVELVDADREELHQLAREVLVRPDAVELGNVLDPVLELAELGRERVLEEQVLERAERMVAKALLELRGGIGLEDRRDEDLVPDVRHAQAKLVRRRFDWRKNSIATGVGEIL